MIHIHNGDVVASRAQRGGIPGRHVAFRESLITGPVVPGPDWLETRAQTLHAEYGEDLLRVRTSLLEQERMLDEAPADDEIVLWFEHDLFCLVHLLALLERFARVPVSLVWSTAPLGFATEGELYEAFGSRSAVTRGMRTVAHEAWAAYISSDPQQLNEIIGRDLRALPFAKDGLTLHASRYPSVATGLGAIEQSALEHVAAGASAFAKIFENVSRDEPHFGFGDTEVMRILRTMAWCATPLITMTGDAPNVVCRITDAGESVLTGHSDALRVNPPDAWLGGVHLTKENVWRWDGKQLSRSAVS